MLPLIIKFLTLFLLFILYEIFFIGEIKITSSFFIFNKYFTIIKNNWFINFFI